MSDLLSVGASGVRANQAALTTTSDNIANAGNAGYVRRSAKLSEVAAANGRVSASSTGNGVRFAGITRAADEQRNAAVRSAGTDLAKTETSIGTLSAIETALVGNQLGSRLTSFFNAARSVAADPTASAPRAVLLENGAGVASAFAGTARALDQVTANIDSTAEGAADSLEALGTSLGKINAGLASATANSSGQAQLLDQRDSVLDQLSALSDLSVTIDDLGRATVKLGGSNGPNFVVGKDVGHITYVRSPSGIASFAVHLNGTAQALTPSGGALAGIVEGAKRVGDAKTELDRIATDFVAGVNAVQAQGRDLDGNPGAPVFAAGAGATDISIVLTNPRGIAAARVGGGPRDNGNLAALETLRTTANFEGATADLTTTNATALESRRTVADAQAAIRDGAISDRDQRSGVNLDAEAVDLLRFQQAYQASSRVIQVAREVFQSIIAIN